jgi:hypothetical protein
VCGRLFRNRKRLVQTSKAFWKKRVFLVVYFLPDFGSFILIFHFLNQKSMPGVSFFRVFLAFYSNFFQFSAIFASYFAFSQISPQFPCIFSQFPAISRVFLPFHILTLQNNPNPYF